MMGTSRMPYQSTTIAKTIPDINEQMYLPAIQREFVWDSDQIVRLFDSVARDYPIGSFLYWDVRGKFAERQVKYRFVKDYITEGVYPNQFDDRTHRNQKVRDEFEDLPNKLTLVLDGQQRLTSFYIGLKGSYTVRGHGKKRKKAESWTRKQLYLNLLSDPTQETDDALQMKYEFKFKRDPTISEDEYWFRVGDVLEMDEDERYDYVDEAMERLEMAGVSPSEINKRHIQKNLDALWEGVKKRQVLNFYPTDRENSERILNVFIRANEGGTQLGRDEILLSISTAEWADTEPSIDARQEITNFVDELNGYRDISGFNFDISFVLKNLLMLSDQPMDYKIDHFMDEEILAEMKSTFRDKRFQQSLFQTLELVDSFGLDGHSVRSSVSLMPLAYFFYNNPNIELSWESEDGQETRRRLFYWLCATLLKSVYGSGTYTKVEGIREVLQNSPKHTFPMKDLSKKLYRYSETLSFPEEEVRDMIRTLRSTNKRVQLLLSLLYYPDPANEHVEYEMDHVFPRSELTMENLVDNYDFSLDRAERFDNLRDNVRNLQLVRKTTNRNKSDKSFIDWIESRNEEYFERHYIPKDPDLYQVERFDEFVRKREELMVDRIRNMSEEVEKALEAELEQLA